MPAAPDADALAATALDLLAIDTRNPPGETAALVDLVDDRLAAAGLHVDRVTVDPAKPNLVATLPGDRDETLLYCGHADTVPVDTAAWTRDPLGERDGDRVYGRGATDMKGPLAAMLHAVEAHAAAAAPPPVTIAVCVVSDEETGGDAGLPAVLEADALHADACVIGETTCERGRHSVTAADRGSIWVTLTAEGHGAHGSRPAMGLNAIDRLYEAVTRLRDEVGATRLDIDPAVRPLVEESVEYYAPILGEDAARALFTYPSVNLGTIEGGSAINAVPETASARIDVRVAPGVDTTLVLDDIRGCVEGCEGVTLADVSFSLGTAEPVDAPVVRATRDVAAAVTGERVYTRSATGGGDAKTLRNAGIPTVEFALGTDTVHGVDEYTTLDALVGNAEIYTRLPAAFADTLG